MNSLLTKKTKMTENAMYKMLALASLAISFLIPDSAFAGNGQTNLPHWAGAPSSGSPQITTLWLTNITTHTLAINVTWYQSDGTVAPSSALTYMNFTSGNTQLAPGTTGYINIQTSSYNWGYATVAWSNIGSDNDTAGLIGMGEFLQKITSSSFILDSITLNSGHSF